MYLRQWHSRLIPDRDTRHRVARRIQRRLERAILRPVVSITTSRGVTPGLVEDIIRANYAGSLRIVWCDEPTTGGLVRGWIAKVRYPGKADVLPVRAEGANGYRNVHRRHRLPMHVHTPTVRRWAE